MHELNIMDYILNFDDKIDIVINYFGVWCYVIFFIIVFAGNGLIVTAFLPGDSLLFFLGTRCLENVLNIVYLTIVLTSAAIIGNVVNYHIGRAIGSKAFTTNSRYFKKEHLIKAHEFFEKYGGKTLIIASFLPIIRTFAPFVAGVSKMSFRKFLFYSVVGALLWVCSITLAGYYFGHLPFVQNNFPIVMLMIVAISVLPAIIGFLATKFKVADNKN